MKKRKKIDDKEIEAFLSKIESGDINPDFLLHDNIDRDRLIWDQNYRNKVKDFLNDEMTKSIYKSKLSKKKS